jgi:hypothetical protein
MAVELVEFTEKTLGEAKSLWIDKATMRNMPISYIEKTFEWAEKRIDYANANGDSFAYCVIDTTTKECLAIVDIIYSRKNTKSALLKMITVNISPDFSTVEIEADISRIDAVLDVYSEAIIGTIRLTSTHISSVIKLYGRNDHMILLLSALKERINSNVEIELKVVWEGRWLTLC